MINKKVLLGLCLLCCLAGIAVPVVAQENNTTLGSGIQYPPHSVRFQVQTLWGSPISNVNVTALGYETTTGDWDWIYQLFGVNATATPIANTSLNGTTDDRGNINFLMFEAVQYNMTFFKTGEINKTLLIYPKDEYYMVYPDAMANTSWYEEGYDQAEVINITVTTSETDPTNAIINVTFVDLIGNTTGGTVFLNQTNEADRTGPETTLSSWAIPAGAGTNSHEFAVTNHRGESYFIRVRATSDLWTEGIDRDYAVTFPMNVFNPWNLSSLQLMGLSVFLICFLSCMFGATSRYQGGVIVCAFAWWLWSIGWMSAVGDTAVLALTVATFIAILAAVMARSKQEA